MKKKEIFILTLLIVIFSVGKVYASGIDEINLISFANITCEGIFGSKSDPNSLRSLINDILFYPKVLVPIIVIVLGIMDFAKAVFAGKADVMSKAQKTFAKRVVIGVAFFFIPVFIDIIMELADIVWNGQYTSCGL